MSSYKMTLIGLEKYCSDYNDSLFTNLRFPEGIDKELAINVIMQEAAELPLLYSEPSFLQHSIRIWGQKHYRTFDKWVEALNLEYEPLWNYDRTEEWTDSHSGEDKRKDSKSSRGSGTETVKNKTEDSSNGDSKVTTDMTVESDDTTTNSVSAYNASGFSNKDQSVLDGEQNTTGTVETTSKNSGISQGTMTTDQSDQRTDSMETSGTNEYNNIHKGHITGNIGVMSSQELLQRQLDISEWNLYHHIADLFIEEFCIMVY